MKSVVLLVCIAANLASACLGQYPGSVEAKVVDENGQTMSDAIVEAEPIGIGKILAMVLPWCQTDINGACTIQHLEFGKYRLSASKEDLDYPKLQFSFYAKAYADQPVVNLSADQSSMTVMIHLGKKAGVLRSKVTDAVSGKLLSDFSFKFNWVSDPKNVMNGSGRSRILIPPDTPVTLTVHAQGYEDWVYSLGRGSLQNAILLHPGEELNLDIRMWPKQ